MGGRNKEEILCFYCDLSLFFIALLFLFKVSYRERLWKFILGLSIPAATFHFTQKGLQKHGVPTFAIWYSLLCIFDSSYT